MLIYWICLILGIVATAIFISSRAKASTPKAAVEKSIASVFFIGTAISAFASSGIPGQGKVFGLLVIGGLVFGMLGDIWLDLKFVYRNDDNIFTFAGFYSFAAGHALFITGLIYTFADFTKPLYIILPVIIGIATGCATVLCAKLMKLEYGKFKAVSMFYASILITMTLLCGSFALMNGFKVMTLNFMFVGGVFFLVSDLILSGTYFGVGKNRKIDIITNHATYYIAQFIIASSLLFLE